jgi:hypothetical protein
MAEKETKTIRITDPSKQSDTTLLWESFGWKLESAYDVIKPATPRCPGYYHVELHFERDPAMPNYSVVLLSPSSPADGGKMAPFLADLSAAQYCDELVYGACDDWFLPSNGELNVMYANLKQGVFSAGFFIFHRKPGLMTGSRGFPPANMALLIFNLVLTGMRETIYEGDRKKLVRFIVRFTKRDKASLAELEELAEQILVLDKLQAEIKENGATDTYEHISARLAELQGDELVLKQRLEKLLHRELFAEPAQEEQEEDAEEPEDVNPGQRVFDSVTDGICTGIETVTDLICAPLEWLTDKISSF